MAERLDEASLQVALVIRASLPALLLRAIIWSTSLGWLGQNNETCPYLPVAVGFGTPPKCRGLEVRGAG